MIKTKGANVAVLWMATSKESLNRRLLDVLPQLAPPDMRFTAFEHISELPFYNQDLDNGETPTVVTRFRASIRSAEGLVIATPEYRASSRIPRW